MMAFCNKEIMFKQVLNMMGFHCIKSIVGFYQYVVCFKDVLSKVPETWSVPVSAWQQITVTLVWYCVEIFLSLTLTKNCLFLQPLHGIFDFLVPRTIYQRIQHGNHHSVEDRCKSVKTGGATRAGTQIDKDSRTIEQGNNCQVRSTGIECLGPALS